MLPKKQSPKGSLTPQAIFKLDLSQPTIQKSNRTRYPSGTAQNLDLSQFQLVSERKLEMNPTLTMASISG